MGAASEVSSGRRLGPIHDVAQARVVQRTDEQRPHHRERRRRVRHQRVAQHAVRRVALEQLELVEAQGYAWVDGELDPSICGMAVPLRDQAGRVVAAISINTISGMVSEAQAKKKFLVPLKRTAQDIRSQMTAVAAKMR